MAQVICSVRVNLFNDGTATHVVHYYNEAGQHVKTKDLEPPPVEGFQAHYAAHAPEGHPLAVKPDDEEVVDRDIGKIVDGSDVEPDTAGAAISPAGDDGNGESER